MLYLGLLALHVLVAAATVCVALYSLYAVARRRDAAYPRLALWLGLIAGFEVMSGTALALLSQTLLASELGLHIALYLGVCLAVELLLFMRMKAVPNLFPAEVAATPVIATFVFVAVASLGL